MLMHAQYHAGMAAGRRLLRLLTPVSSHVGSDATAIVVSAWQADVVKPVLGRSVRYREAACELQLLCCRGSIGRANTGVSVHARQLHSTQASDRQHSGSAPV